MQRYCAYIDPPNSATVLSLSAWAASEAPAATTTPAPSLPTAMETPRRPAMARMARSGIRAVTTGRSAVPDTVAVLMSAAPNSRPRSDGLMGEASMRTRTSCGAGCGTVTSTSDTSSSPVDFTSERNCSARALSAGVMGDLLIPGEPDGLNAVLRMAAITRTCSMTAQEPVQVFERPAMGPGGMHRRYQ